MGVEAFSADANAATVPAYTREWRSDLGLIGKHHRGTGFIIKNVVKMGDILKKLFLLERTSDER
jgi:hypothetical protein